MNTKLHHTVLLGILLASACDAPYDEFDVEHDDSLAQQALDIDELDDGAEVPAQPAQFMLDIPGIDPECALRRAPVILRLEDAQECELERPSKDPLWDRWTPSRVFEMGSPHLTQLDHTAPGRLSRYCKYEYSGTEDDELADDYEQLTAAIQSYDPAGFEKISTDCVGVAPMAGLTQESLMSRFHEVFLDAVGAVAPDLTASLDMRPIRLGLLDTVGEEPKPRHAHGQQMRSIIEALTGEQPELLIHHSLVTPRVGPGDADWFQGGNVGYASDYASGMYFEILEWLDQIRDEQQDIRLILAASVGYDPGIAPYANDPNRATQGMLQDIHMLATCYGVLSFAAAGNLRPGTCSTDLQEGMLAPAKLEELSPPTRSECLAQFGLPDELASLDAAGGIFSGNSNNSVAGRRAYAAGGLDNLSQPIRNARPDSLPKMAAYALAGSGDPRGLDEFGSVAPMTGTSISTAAMSAAAAMYWASDPTRTPAEVYEAIYQSGWTTGQSSEAGAAPGSTVRRLSICRLLESAGLGTGPCPSHPPSWLWGASSILEETLSIVDATDPADLVQATLQQPQIHTCQDYTYDQVVRPQPDKPVCSSCSGSTDFSIPSDQPRHTVRMSITNERWSQNLDVGRAYIHVLENSGSVVSYPLHHNQTIIDQINQANPRKIIEASWTSSRYPLAATLEFIYDDAAGTTYTTTLPYTYTY